MSSAGGGISTAGAKLGCATGTSANSRGLRGWSTTYSCTVVVQWNQNKRSSLRHSWVRHRHFCQQQRVAQVVNHLQLYSSRTMKLLGGVCHSRVRYRHFRRQQRVAQGVNHLPLYSSCSSDACIATISESARWRVITAGDAMGCAAGTSAVIISQQRGCRKSVALHG